MRCRTVASIPPGTHRNWLEKTQQSSSVRFEIFASLVSQCPANLDQLNILVIIVILKHFLNVLGINFSPICA